MYTCRADNGVGPLVSVMAELRVHCKYPCTLLRRCVDVRVDVDMSVCARARRGDSHKNLSMKKLVMQTDAIQFVTTFTYIATLLRTIVRIYSPYPQVYHGSTPVCSNCPSWPPTWVTRPSSTYPSSGSPPRPSSGTGCTVGYPASR